MTVIVVVGTRPEIIKMAPLIKELHKKGIAFTFIHTGQHYDYVMSEIFIKQLELPPPHVSLELTSEDSVAQVGEMIVKLKEVLEGVVQDRGGSVVLVQGDTNSTLAVALTALKLGFRIGHVEAGLRSFDWKMPEEHNRRIVDHISDYLFAPTEIARENLLRERVYGEVFVTGNTVIDAVNMYFDKVIEVEHRLFELLKFDTYALVTFHRAENVDNPITLENFVKILEKSPIPLIFPIHPRTKKRLQEFGLWSRVEGIQHLQLIPPQGYFEFLALMKNCKVIMTDSGGLQEEATHPKIRKPVLVLRKSTERPEAVIHGFVRIVGTNPIIVLAELVKILSEEIKLPENSPFGDGKAAIRIIDVVMSRLKM